MAILKIEKAWYLHNRLADFDEILHDDTYWSSRAYQLLKLPPFWKMLNVISQQPFDRFWCNLIQQCILGFPIWMSTKNLNVKKFKMADGGHLENWKIATSSKPFCQFCWKFVRWHILIHHSSSAVKIQNLKIQIGRRLPVWKLLNAIFQQPFGRFWRNLYVNAHQLFQPEWRPQIWKFEIQHCGWRPS